LENHYFKRKETKQIEIETENEILEALIMGQE
jgi:hypothetical protein